MNIYCKRQPKDEPQKLTPLDIVHGFETHLCHESGFDSCEINLITDHLLAFLEELDRRNLAFSNIHL